MDPVHTSPQPWRDREHGEPEHVPEHSATYTQTTELTVGPPEQTIAKAVVAVATALMTGLTTAVSDGNVTWIEVVIMVLGAAIAGGGVWSVTNDKKS